MIAQITERLAALVFASVFRGFPRLIAAVALEEVVGPDFAGLVVGHWISPERTPHAFFFR